MELTLVHKGKHAEADIDRRVEERKQNRNQFAKTNSNPFFWALGTLASQNLYNTYKVEASRILGQSDGCESTGK